MHLTLGEFSGQYVSLALDLPPQALSGLSASHLVQVDLSLQTTRPCGIFLRLNLQCGPNSAQLTRALPQSAGALTVAFDLAYAKFNAKRLDKVWLDMIFEQPERAHMALHDLVLCRRPRAEF